MQQEFSGGKNREKHAEYPKKQEEDPKVSISVMHDQVIEFLAELDTISEGLLSSTDINEVDKLQFEQRLSDMKQELQTEMNGFLEELSSLDDATIREQIKKFKEDIYTDFEPLLVEQLKDIQKQTKISEGVEYLLAHSKFPLAEKILDQYKNLGLSNSPEPQFPLNTASLEIAQTMSKKEPSSLADIEKTIILTNFAYSLMQKGVSLETIQKIDFDRIREDELTSMALNEDTLQKLFLIDRTDLKISLTSITAEALVKISLEKLQILASHPEITLNKTQDFSEKVMDLLTEDAIVKFKAFTNNLTPISIDQLVAFSRDISHLPQTLQNLFKQSYENGLQISEINSGTSDWMENISEEKITLLEELTRRGVALTRMSHFKSYSMLDNSIFDRCDSLGLNIKEIPINQLLEVNSVPQEGLRLFSDILEGSRDIDSSYKNFQSIYQKLGVENGSLFLEWAKTQSNEVSIAYLCDRFPLEAFADCAQIVKSENDIRLLEFLHRAYGSNSLKDITSGWNERFIREKSNLLTQSPELIINDILANPESCKNTFENFSAVESMLEAKGLKMNEAHKDNLFNTVLQHDTEALLYPYSYQMTPEQKKLSLEMIIEKIPVKAVIKMAFLENTYLSHSDNKQQDLNKLFDKAILADPQVILKSKNFPFTEQQLEYLDIFQKLSSSPSPELRNLANEVCSLIARDKQKANSTEIVQKIEDVFLSNTVPLVGKQFKVFEIMYPNKKLADSVSKGNITSLKELGSPSKQKLVIFKDLIRSHIASADTNLEQYLLAIQEGETQVKKFELGETLTENDKQSLKMFLKKISVLSGQIGRKKPDIHGDISGESIGSEIESLRNAFGATEHGSLLQKFERTFLQRVGIENLEEALKLMQTYRNEATKRNENRALRGKISLENGDYVKTISSDFLDEYLDQGVYAPEFIGAETVAAKSRSQRSDYTPLDTDVFRVQDGTSASQLFSQEFGDILIAIKQKDQIKLDDLHISKTGVMNQNHYGIRTGFGSTQIDALYTHDKENNLKMNYIKYLIAKKGIYIPICDFNGDVLYAKEEYDEYRKIFSGIDRYHGNTPTISSEWKKTKYLQEITKISQTKENMKSVESLRDTIVDKIRKVLDQENISLHKGRYDTSLEGAVITDTGSTSRGTFLSDKLDFDFAIKLDYSQWQKLPKVIENLGKVFPQDEVYENKGMFMFRSGEIGKSNLSVTVDVGFVQKSVGEKFDANRVLEEKYESIRKTHGEEVYLDVLSNIRFAKKKLKEAGCYKKGVTQEHREGGIGGIGVEYWILHNDGDAIKAFENFAENAYQDGDLLPFESFKRKYTIFSAGENIRGKAKVENFMDNMTEEGYKNMAALAKQFSA